MKRIILFVFGLSAFLLLLMSFSGVASARQEVTPSPSPTITPLPTSTPYPVSNDCPSGLPVGWGTYTPSALYNLECGGCVATSTPSPSPTLDGTLYPTEYAYTSTAVFLTGTPTFTPSPTVTPSPTLGYYPVEVPSCEGISFDGGGSVDCDVSLSCSSDVVVGAVWDMYAPIASNFGEYGLYTKAMGFEGYPQVKDFLNSNPTLTVYTNSWRITQFDLETLLSIPAGSHYLGSPIGMPDSFPLTLSISAWDFYVGDTVRHGVMSNVRVLCYGSNPPVIPSPTPAPASPLDVCASIAPSDDDYFGFDLFIPNGAKNCDMGWDEFEVAGYVIPAVEICFQPSQFGVITLFGTAFEMGFLALVTAAAFLYRYFRTSS